MTRGRQADFKISKIIGRKRANMGVMKYATVQYQRRPDRTGIRSMEVLAVLGRRYKTEREEEDVYTNQRNHIFSIDFGFTFNKFTDLDCLLQLRFTHSVIYRLIPILSWPPNKTHATRNRYYTSPIPSACIILQRLFAPARWRDLTELFGKWKPHLSEILWESLAHLLDARLYLIKDPVDKDYKRKMKMNESPTCCSQVYREPRPLRVWPIIVSDGVGVVVAVDVPSSDGAGRVGAVVAPSSRIGGTVVGASVDGIDDALLAGDGRGAIGPLGVADVPAIIVLLVLFSPHVSAKRLM